MIPVQTHHCFCFLPYRGHCQDTVQRAIHIGDDLHMRERDTHISVFSARTQPRHCLDQHTPLVRSYRAIKTGHIERCILSVEYLSVAALKFIICTISFWLQPRYCNRTTWAHEDSWVGNREISLTRCLCLRLRSQNQARQRHHLY